MCNYRRGDACLEAEKKIEQALKSSATQLNLSNWLPDPKLTELPESICQLTQLEEPILNGNDLVLIPLWIGSFPQLRVLSFWRNKLTTLPESLGNLTKLQSLNLSSNQLSAIPQSLSNLKRLQRLNLSNNQLATLSMELAN